jgi:hypothetical protein
MTLVHIFFEPRISGGVKWTNYIGLHGRRRKVAVARHGRSTTPLLIQFPFSFSCVSPQ